MVDGKCMDFNVNKRSIQRIDLQFLLCLIN